MEPSSDLCGNFEKWFAKLPDEKKPLNYDLVQLVEKEDTVVYKLRKS